MTDRVQPRPDWRCRPIKAIVFDAYGTLVQIGEALHPYRRLLSLAAAHGRHPQPDDDLRLLMIDGPLSDAMAWLGVALPASEIEVIERTLQAELLTIRRLPGVWNVLEQLRSEGYAIGLCSNVARPYAAPVQTLLAGMIDSSIWSFKAGCVKPNPAIYKLICSALGTIPQQTLFVGRNRETDVDGPREIGMQALQLAPSGNRTDPRALGSLADLIRLLCRSGSMRE